MSSYIPILERFISLTKDEANLIIGSEQEAANFITKLKKLQEGLQDAEKKQVTESNVKSWLQELKDLQEGLQDTLDEWQIFNAWKKEERSVPWFEVLSTLIQDLCLCFDRIRRQRELTLEMKSLLKKLDGLLDERGRFNLVPSSSSETKPFMPPETTSKVDAKTVFGRDSDLKKLLSALLDQGNGESTSTSIRVVSLVGAGGLGKTTLSQLAYKHQRVDDHFERKLWVSVSNPFDASRVARGILRDAGQTVDENSTLQALTTRVESLVSNKKFFLVLDNVWLENIIPWGSLITCLTGAPGSRILVTTRNENVSRMIGSAVLIKLKPLSNTDCEKILNAHALIGRTEAEMATLRPIGIDIAKKCGGFPLAAKLLGGMLSSRDTQKQWQDVLGSPVMEHKDGVDELLKILKLSYDDLSPDLKLCFSSCAILRKGDYISRDELIRIWLSKGYLSLDAGAEKVQSKGEECFDYLAMRSFFLKEYDKFWEQHEWKIHDVMHDFAIHLSKNEYCYSFDGRADGENKMDYYSSDHSKMRTFVVRSASISQQHLVQLATSLKKARLLILKDCDLKEIPEEIGKLVHLRYLDLSWNDMKELPETLCDLYHLQTLCLEHCYKLSMLPEGIHKLVNLRHILFDCSYNIKFPRGLKYLTCLWHLDGEFRVGRGWSKLGYLKNLNQLHGRLSIWIEGDLNEEADVEEAKEAYLGNKEKIEFLYLKISGEVSKNVIEALLQPPCNLKRLYIKGGKLEWLSSCGKLPSLEELTVYWMFGRSLGVEFWGINNCGGSHLGNRGVNCSFPNLKRLTFMHCWSWEKWEDIGENELVDNLPAPIFPHLQELEIRSCDRLEALPHNLIRKLSSLQFLNILDSECLKEAYGEGGLHRHNISRIPNITIY